MSRLPCGKFTFKIDGEYGWMKLCAVSNGVSSDSKGSPDSDCLCESLCLAPGERERLWSNITGPPRWPDTRRSSMRGSVYDPTGPSAYSVFAWFVFGGGFHSTGALEMYRQSSPPQFLFVILNFTNGPDEGRKPCLRVKSLGHVLEFICV